MKTWRGLVQLRILMVMNAYRHMCHVETDESVQKYFEILEDFRDFCARYKLDENKLLPDKEFDKIDNLYEKNSVNLHRFIYPKIFK